MGFVLLLLIYIVYEINSLVNEIAVAVEVALKLMMEGKVVPIRTQSTTEWIESNILEMHLESCTIIQLAVINYIQEQWIEWHGAVGNMMEMVILS